MSTVIDDIKKAAAALLASPDGNTWDYPDGTWEGGMRKYQRVISADACDRAARQGTMTFAHMLDATSRDALAEEDKVALRGKLIAVAALCALWIEHLDRGTSR
jgi:hypothetical protein